MEQKPSEKILKIRAIYRIVMAILVTIAIGFTVSGFIGPTLNPIQ